MARRTYSEYQTFTQNWQGYFDYAHKMGMPFSQVLPVFQQDASRYLTGGTQNTLSGEEIVRQLYSVRNQAPVTAAPQQSAANVGTNIFHDLASVATSLIHAPSTIFHTIKDTIEHPDHVIHPLAEELSGIAEMNPHLIAQSFRDAANNSTNPNDPTLLSFIPGVSLISQLTTPGGRHEAGIHPLISTLDVLPIGDGLLSGAGKLGLVSKDIAGGGVVRLAGKGISNIPMGHGITLGSYSANLLDKHNIGPMMRTVMSQLQQNQRVLQNQTEDFIKPMKEAIKKFNQKDLDTLQEITSFRRTTPERINADPKIPDHVKQVYNMIDHLSTTTFPAFALENGKGFMTQMPDGHVEFTTNKKLNLKSLKTQRKQQKVVNLAKRTRTSGNNLVLLETTVQDQAEKIASDLSQKVLHIDLLNQVETPKVDFLRRSINVGMNRLVADVKNFRYARASRRLRTLSRLFDGVGRNGELSTAAEDIRSQLESYNNVIDYMEKNRTAFNKMQSRMKDVKNDYLATEKDFQNYYSSHPPERYYPLIVRQAMEELKSKAGERINNMRELSQLTSIISEGDWTNPLFEHYFLHRDNEGKVTNEVTQILDDLKTHWESLHDQGFDPLYTPNIIATKASSSIAHLARPSILTDRMATMDMWKKRGLDLTNVVNHPGLSAMHGYIQLLEYLATDHFQKWLENSSGYVKSGKELAAIARVKYGDRQLIPFVNQGGQIEAAISSRLGYTPYSPETIFPTSSKPLTGMGITKDQKFIPTPLYQSLSRMMGRNQSLRLPAAYDKVTKLFRFSVLGLSPRFIAHIAVGGLVMTAMRTGPTALLYLPKAFNYVVKHQMPDDIRDHLQTHQGLVGGDDLFQYNAGKTQARVANMAATNRLGGKWETVKDRVLGAQDLMRNFTSTISDMQRTIAYLYAAGKAKRHGADYNLQMQAGLHLANKVLANHDTLTPIERTFIRNVMPFYSWTRHVLVYTMTYPIDHPLRASFLANIAWQQEKDNKSGIPLRWDLLFNIGMPDQSGNQEVVDVRAADPFRDVANLFTVQGVIEQLNPVISGIISYTFNYDPVTGASKELYPQLTYNDIYGVDQQQGEGVGKLGVDLLQQIIPQTQVFANLLSTSASLRNLRRTDPSAYTQRLFAMGNFPWIPYTENIPQRIATTQKDLYGIARSATKNAFYSGNFQSLIDEYGLNTALPFQPGGAAGGAIVEMTPKNIIAYYNSLKQENLNLGQMDIPSDVAIPLPAHRYE